MLLSLNLSQGVSSLSWLHLPERRVTGLSLASWHLLRGRLRVLCSFPGSCISLGLSWWHCLCEVTFPHPNFSVLLPTCSTSSPGLFDSWWDCSTLQINDLVIHLLLCLALPSLINFIRLPGVEIPKLTLPEITKSVSSYILGQRN